MNQIAIIDDLAARRSAAAHKAAATRRARATGLPQIVPQKLTSAAEALAAFDRQANSDSPDWHAAALALKRALTAIPDRPATKPPALKINRPTALAAPAWPDYPVDNLGSFKVRNPTIVVTFADGEVVRAPAVSAKDKPVNIGRGLRIAIAFYQARLCRRSGLKFKPVYIRSVPAITACICEDTGEIFDADQCTIRTAATRQQHDRRRIEACPD